MIAENVHDWLAGPQRFVSEPASKDAVKAPARSLFTHLLAYLPVILIIVHTIMVFFLQPLCAHYRVNFCLLLRRVAVGHPAQLPTTAALQRQPKSQPTVNGHRPRNLGRPS